MLGSEESHAADWGARVPQNTCETRQTARSNSSLNGASYWQLLMCTCWKHNFSQLSSSGTMWQSKHFISVSTASFFLLPSARVYGVITSVWAAWLQRSEGRTWATGHRQETQNHPDRAHLLYYYWASATVIMTLPAWSLGSLFKSVIRPC